MAESYPPIPKAVKKAIIKYFNHVHHNGVRIGQYEIDVTAEQKFKEITAIAPDLPESDSFMVDDMLIIIKLIEWADGTKVMETEICQRFNKYGDKYYGASRDIYISNQEKIGWLLNLVDCRI